MLQRTLPQVLEQLESRTLLSHGHSISPALILEQYLPRQTASHSFVLTHRHGSVRPRVSAGPVGLTPATMRHAYGIDLARFGAITGDGSGQTIAIVDAYDAPTITSDLAAFDARFGLAAPPSFTKIGQSGSSALPSADTYNRGNSWAVETSLDVEWAHAVAPGASIVLVEANSASNSDLFAAINTARSRAGVSVVSMSWGEDEFSGQSYYDSYFTTPSGHTGVTFVASSGDSGAYDTYYYPPLKTAEFPASSPNVVGVGGTTLSADSSGNYRSESGWNGSGGGISQVVSQPAYQKGIVTQSTTRRTVPDVSFDADPSSGVAVVDSWDFGTATPWEQIGGTSLAAPMWAGVIAIANQGRVLNGLGAFDGATGTLPKLYSLPASDFHDITSGNNGLGTSQYPGYSASGGYDLVTGRGTPIVNLLVADLAGSQVTPTPVIGSLAVSPASVTAGTSVTLTASNVQEINGTISTVTFYRESNGSSGLQVGSDTLIGTGSRSGTTWTTTASTTGLSPGNYTYYALAKDGANVSSAPASTTLTIQAPAAANDMFAGAATFSGAQVAGSNINATKESGEPSITTNAGGKSVWWNWTAPASGLVSLNTHGSSFDTLLGVFTGGSVTTLTKIASNDDDPAGGTLTSALTFAATKGTVYHFVVDGYSAASGSITVNLAQMAAPANDLFANATALAANTGVWAASNVGATKESGEPNHAGLAGGASVWFAWTAPTSRQVSINTHGSTFDTVLAVYTGGAVNGLTAIAANDDDPAGGTLTSAVTFSAVAGVKYRIAVDGYRAATGSISLSIV